MIEWPEHLSADNALRHLKRIFVDADISTAELDARLIILDRLGLRHEDLIADPHNRISDHEKSRIEEAALRRVAHEPMSHILGRREFYGRNFFISSDVLTPRPDSEVLIDTCIELLQGKKTNLRFLDLGVGSGCLLLSLLGVFPQAEGVGVDVSRDALNMADKNALSLGLAARTEFLEGDWFGPVEGQYDLIISNPPYIETDHIKGLQKEVRDYEPHLALDGGADGLNPYRDIIKHAPLYLKEGGILVLEIGHTQKQQVYGIFEKYAEMWDLRKVGTMPDLAGRDRCVYARIQAPF